MCPRKMECFFKDEAPTQPSPEGRKCLCTFYADLVREFQSDRFFDAILESLKIFKSHYEKMPVKKAVDVITSYLRLCNIGCAKSGMKHEQDFTLFALYLYNTIVLI